MRMLSEVAVCTAVGAGRVVPCSSDEHLQTEDVPMRPRPSLLLAAAAALVLAACGGDGSDAEDISLDATADETAPEALADDDGAGDDGAGDDGESDDGDGGDSATAGDVVDGTEAVPGTWQVGDAGTVTFDIVDGALVLEDISENEGWAVTDVEEEPDEIEVDFRRDNVEIMIEIELTSGGSILEIEIDTDIENAEPGTYDIGDAGTFTFDVTDGALELVDLTANDGWEVTEQEVDGDDIEIELRNGAMRWDVDVDLNGSVTIDLDFEITGQV